MTAPAARPAKHSPWPHALKRVYRRLIRPSEFFVNFYYSRPWETERVVQSRGG